jgi:hypothetical protein
MLVATEPRAAGPGAALPRLLIALALVGASCNKTPQSDDVAPLPGPGFPGSLATAAAAGPAAQQDGAGGTGAPAEALVPVDGGGAKTTSTDPGGQGGESGEPGPTAGGGAQGATDAAVADLGVAPVDREPVPVTAVCGISASCFDFEQGTAGQAPGAPWSGHGTLDSAHVFSGSKALRVAAGDDEAFATMGAPFFPVANNEYFGRVMAWTAEVPNDHWTFIRSRGRSAEKGFQAEYTYGGSGKKIIANYDTPDGPSSDCWKDGGEFAVGKWVCLEWHFKGASNELELWVDGVADPAHVVGKGDGCKGNGTGKVWYAPTFTNLQLGYAIYGGSGGRSVWFDDLALSASGRIGCPAPK